MTALAIVVAIAGVVLLFGGGALEQSNEFVRFRLSRRRPWRYVYVSTIGIILVYCGTVLIIGAAVAGVVGWFR